MKLENKLKIARVAHGDLTQQDLAEKVGCSRQTIHSIESGKFVPSVELALKIAKVLKVTVEEIFFFSKESS
ncbi:MAG TPA: helix-turn-helix transcriptional regulator [Bdellovibrio sp.]|nr:helix-turn-helix transcriptional regulator [Bdellovibrio sp.]